MSWKHYVTDLRTGLIVGLIDIPSFSWDMTVGSFGFQTTDKGLGDENESSVTVPWTALNADTPSARNSLLSQGRRAICTCWEDDSTADDRGTPIMWGAIGAREDTWLDTSFPVESPMTILASRYAIRDGAFHKGTSTDTIAYDKLSFRAIACKLIAIGTSRKKGGELPIDLPYLNEKGSHQRENWQAWNVQNLGIQQLLTNLSNVIGGPDMTFRPYWKDDKHVRVEFLAGSDAGIYLDSKNLPVTLNCYPGGGSLENLKIDYSMPIQRVYATGSGEDAATITALAEDLTEVTQTTDPPILREAVFSDTDCANPDLLENKAKGKLTDNRPLMQFTGEMDVQDRTTDGTLMHPLGSFWPGNRFDLDISDFPSIPDGRYECRLMEMSGDQSSKVELKFDVLPVPFA